MRASAVLGRALIAAILLAAGLYAGDDLWVRYRLAHKRARDPLDEVTFYYATALKSGRVEVFYDQPGREVCVHAIFAHLGYRPCWYAGRSHVRMASRAGEASPPRAAGAGVTGSGAARSGTEKAT